MCSKISHINLAENSNAYISRKTIDVDNIVIVSVTVWHQKQEGLAVASIARDDPSTLPSESAMIPSLAHS